MISSIYHDRFFEVRDCGSTSARRQQHSGIVQGCPLSPFRFIILVSVLMHDAHNLLSEGAKLSVKEDRLYDLLYADDTLLIGTNAKHVGELAAAVEKIGARFGMSLHWGKTQAISVGSSECITSSQGQQIPSSESMVYVGGLPCGDARMDSEISRRIGAASGVFRSLHVVWSRCSLPTKKRLQFFSSLVVYRLLYGLSSSWLVKRQIRRLEGFYARCLRRILGIPAAFISRVSNATVLARAGTQSLEEQLRRGQLSLLAKAAQAPSGSALRRNVFLKDTLKLVVGHFIQRVGRPRQAWTTSLMQIGADKCRDRFEDMLSSRKSWQHWPA